MPAAPSSARDGGLRQRKLKANADSAETLTEEDDVSSTASSVESVLSSSSDEETDVEEISPHPSKTVRSMSRVSLPTPSPTSSADAQVVSSPDSSHEQDERQANPSNPLRTDGEEASDYMRDFSTRKRLWRRAQAEGHLMWELMQHTWLSIKKGGKTNYCLGCSACCVVVLTVALFLTIINNTPVVMLRLAELEAGEVDLQCTPRETRIEVGTAAQGLTLNYTKLGAHLQRRTDEVKESSPSTAVDLTFSTARVVGQVFGFDPSACLAVMDNMDPAWKYSNTMFPGCEWDETCFARFCPADPTAADLFLVDSEREKRMNLGRAWELDAPKPGHCWMQSALASNLGLAAGDVVLLDISGSVYFGNWFSHSIYPVAQNAVGEDVPTNHIFVPVIIQDTFASASGKFGADISDAIIMEMQDFLPYVAKHVNPVVPFAQRTNFSSQDIFAFSREIILNLPAPRIDAYLSSDYDTIQESVVDFASTIVYEAGFNQLEIDLPVLRSVRGTSLLGLFLGLILNVVTVVLLALAVMLIYSLMMVSVETRTFELGVLRMVGMTRRGIIELLIFQGLAYAIPAWILGLILAQVASAIVMQLFEDVTNIPIDAQLTPDAVAIATALGLLIPVIASIIPIRTALTSNLHDALDTTRNKNKAVKMSIHRSEDGAVSASFVILGVGLSVFGFSVYYLLPLSLLSQNFFLLLNLFFFLLLGMLFGLTLLSLNLQHPLEVLLVRGLLWWEQSSVSKIVLKNLTAHRERNRKTTIMFALSLGFIIFVLVSFGITVDSFTFGLQRERGAFLIAEVDVRREDSTTVPVGPKLQRILENTAASSDLVVDWAWLSGDLESLSPTVESLEATTIGHVFRDSQVLRTASPSIMTATFTQFLDIKEQVPAPRSSSDDPGMTPMQQIFTVRGSSSVLLGSAYQDKLSLDSINSSLIVEIRESVKGADLLSVTMSRAQPLAFVSASPALTFSAFPTVSGQDLAVSSPAFVRLSNGVFSGVEEVPWLKLLLKFKDDATEADIASVRSSFTQIIENSKNIGEPVPKMEMWDYYRAIEPINTAVTIMSAFFTFVAVLAMTVAAFSLISSMFTNIHEQGKEIGIMRAIGISRGLMYRIYSYEGLIVVLSSSLMGFLIGTVVGYTMTIQRVLFTQLPVPFVVPWMLLLVIVALSLVFAVLSSVLPLAAVLRASIVTTLRRTT